MKSALEEMFLNSIRDAVEEHEVWRLTQLASSTCRVVVTSRSSLTTESIYHQKRYPHFHNADGIAIDADNNIVITSRNPSSTVVVYSPSGRLIKKYNSFKSAADAAIVYKQNRRPTLVLADNGSGTSGNVKVYTG